MTIPSQPTSPYATRPTQRRPYQEVVREEQQRAVPEEGGPGWGQLAVDVIPSMMGGVWGAGRGIQAAKWAGKKYAPGMLPALFNKPGVREAGIRAAARMPGAGLGAGGAEYGYRRFINPHEDISPETHAYLAGGTELAMHALSPGAHAAGKIALIGLERAGMRRGVNFLSRIMRVPGPMGETRVGADEAIRMFDSVASQGRGAGGYVSAAQVMENFLIEQIEGGARWSFSGMGLHKAAKKGAKTLSDELWHMMGYLEKNLPPDQAIEILEAVLKGSSEVHAATTRTAYRMVDEALDAEAARRAAPRAGTTWWRYTDETERVMVDMRGVIEEAKKWAAPGRAGEGMRKTQSQFLRELENAGEFVTFEDAHLLKSSINNFAKEIEERPGAVTKMARKLSKIISDEMHTAGKNIPGSVRYPWEKVSGRSGAQAIEEVPEGPFVSELYRTATDLAREGFEVFNESMLGPALRTATPEQFQGMVVAGVRAPAMLRVVKETLSDPRYAGAIRSMGRKEGIDNLTGQRLWDGVRGQWLQEQMIQAMPEARTGIISGTNLYNRLVKPRVNRAMLPELFDKEEVGLIKDLANALATVQNIPTGAVGKTVVTLMQFGALSIGAAQLMGQDTPGGWGTPLAFVLTPLALGRLARNPSVVRSLVQGISGKVPAAGVARWMSQMMREFYTHDMPFTAVMPDGTEHAIDPEAHKRRKGSDPLAGTKQQRGRRAPYWERTAIPSP
jgi:hypothetical protein